MEDKGENNNDVVIFVTEFRFQISASEEKEEADLYSSFSLLLAPLGRLLIASENSDSFTHWSDWVAHYCCVKTKEQRQFYTI